MQSDGRASTDRPIFFRRSSDFEGGPDPHPEADSLWAGNGKKADNRPRITKSEPEDMAMGYVTLGAGPFCTNPSLVLVAKNNETHFTNAAIDALKRAAEQPMLTAGIAKAYAETTALVWGCLDVETVFAGAS